MRWTRIAGGAAAWCLSSSSSSIASSSLPLVRPFPSSVGGLENSSSKAMNFWYSLASGGPAATTWDSAAEASVDVDVDAVLVVLAVVAEGLSSRRPTKVWDEDSVKRLPARRRARAKAVSGPSSRMEPSLVGLSRPLCDWLVGGGDR